MLWPQTLMACPRQGASPCLPAPLVPTLPPRGGVLPAGPTTERLSLTRAHRPRAPSPHTDRSCPSLSLFHEALRPFACHPQHSMSAFAATGHPGLEPQCLWGQVLPPARCSAQQGPREPALACSHPSGTPFLFAFASVTSYQSLPCSLLSAGSQGTLLSCPSRDSCVPDTNAVLSAVSFHSLRKRNRKLKRL